MQLDGTLRAGRQGLSELIKRSRGCAKPGTWAACLYCSQGTHLVSKSNRKDWRSLPILEASQEIHSRDFPNLANTNTGEPESGTDVILRIFTDPQASCIPENFTLWKADSRQCFGQTVLLVGNVFHGAVVETHSSILKERERMLRFMANKKAKAAKSSRSLLTRIYVHRGFYLMFIPVFIFVLLFGSLLFVGICTVASFYYYEHFPATAPTFSWLHLS